MNSFDNFIIIEKKYNKIFLNLYDIHEDELRFDINFYDLISEVWKNNDLIEKIYSVIDDVLLKEKIYINDLRYLIIGDIFFTMITLDMNDPSSFVFKTSRTKYINKITLRSYILDNCLNKYINYVKIHQKILIGLRIIDVIDRKQVKMFDTEWKTLIYVKMKIDSIIKNDFLLNNSKHPYKIIKINNNYYCISFFRNIFLLKRKKREMVDYDIDIKSVEISNNIGYKISSFLYNINKIYINKDLNNLLEMCGYSNIDNYINDVRCYINTNDVYDINNTLIKYFNKIITHNLFNKNIFDNTIYFACFIDNRGRQYYNGILSPTFNSIIRNMCEFEEKKYKFNFLYTSTYYKKIKKYFYLIEKYNLNDLMKYIMIVLLIEIGKFFIIIKNNCMIKTENIISLGLINYSNRNFSLETKDIIYINKIYNLLDNLLLKNEIDYNTMILKDATASGLQNYGIILGYKINMLPYININNDDWCDTYQYIIDKYIKDEKYKNRKYWKSTIMTIPYNSVWYSCFNKFLNNLRKNKIEYNDLNDDDKNYLKKMHKSFYDSVKNELKNEFYINDKENLNIIKFKYNKYNIHKVNEYKITYKNERDKYREITYNYEYDDKATNTALEANNMHYLDAKLVKKILNTHNVLTIHDCFGIRLCELHEVMDNINNYYSEIIKMDTYSIHIIK